MRDPITGAPILAPLAETVLLLGFGALPATFMCLGAYGMWQGEASTLENLRFAATLLGTAGLWNTIFYKPSRPGPYGLFILILLLCGVIAIAPITGAVLFGLLKEPSSILKFGVTEPLVMFWFAFGPAGCAAYVFARQLVVRVRSMKKASNKPLQPIARENARTG